uniref:Uncharacterized protein n=1 Tax=Anguilla anguilla TaxID=7936 RepID=A0A0E9X2X0_ANGAN
MQHSKKDPYHYYYRHLADALIQSDLYNFFKYIFYIASIYTAGYILKQCRLSTLLKGTTAVPYLGIKPVTFRLARPAPYPLYYTADIDHNKIFKCAILLRFALKQHCQHHCLHF